jgi:short-subunit dehydrogenase
VSTPVRPLALVTGASSGIGFELALRFADGGYDLVVAAEDDELSSAAAQLRTRGGGVEAVQVDLSTAAGVEELYARVRTAGRLLDAAALNAGVGLGHAFVEEELQEVLQLIDLNVRGTAHLAHLVLRDMVARERGRLLLTSSIASTMPGTYQAVYNASKSFVQALALALQEELRGSPVTVTSLMPGPTDTRFFARAGMLDTRIGRSSVKDDPAEVARQGYEAMVRGDRRVVAGSLMTKVMGAGNKVLPEQVKAVAHRLMAQPKR